METIKIIEKRFRRYPVLKLEGFEKNEKETLKEFILNFFKVYNRNFCTHRAKNNIHHCWGNSRNRSIQDLFGICRFYFKRVTLKEVLIALFENVKENKKHFYGFFCGDVLRYIINFNDCPYNCGLSVGILNRVGDYNIAELLEELEFRYYEIFN